MTDRKKRQSVSKRTQQVPQKKRTVSTKTRNERKRIRLRNKKIKKLLHSLLNVLFYLVVLGVLTCSILFAITQKNDQSLGGYRAFGVLSNSMVSPDNTIKSGGFRAGDIIVLKELPKEAIKVGDVITYHPSLNPANKSTNYLTHRVVEINDHLGEEEGLFFTTRGDANQSDDMPVASKQVVGKVIFHIPKVGGFLSFVKENPFVSSVFLVSIVGFIWVVRTYILSEKVSNQSKKNAQKRNKRRSIMHR